MLFIYKKNNSNNVIINQQKSEVQLLDLVQEYYNQEDYDKIAEIYSNSLLMDNPYAMLNTGVMFANGLYFKEDMQQARIYFYKALDNGELFYSIKYLLSILPYNTDDDLKEIVRILKIGCNNNNKYCEQILQHIYQYFEISNFGESYLVNFNSKSDEEQLEILNKIFLKVEVGSYTQAKNWKYIIDEDGNVTAVVTETEEVNIFARIKRLGLLSTEYKMIFE